MLTTKDNPYNPNTQWREWFAWDAKAGYNSCAYLERVARVSDELSPKEYDEEVKRAIDSIVAFDDRFKAFPVELVEPNIEDPVKTEKATEKPTETAM